jgi:hypothetical protein
MSFGFNPIWLLVVALLLIIGGLLIGWGPGCGYKCGWVADYNYGECIKTGSPASCEVKKQQDFTNCQFSTVCQ